MLMTFVATLGISGIASRNFISIYMHSMLAHSLSGHLAAVSCSYTRRKKSSGQTCSLATTITSNTWLQIGESCRNAFIRSPERHRTLLMCC